MSTTSLNIGQTVSHYRITGMLGAGGMGVVYRAEDQALRREVALKFLPGEVAADPAARKRLVNEAQAASRLNHPNIATVFEVHEGGDTPFIAMELVSGQSLKDILLRGPLPASRVLEVARQIAEGLHEAHQAGVLHHDIKPGNIVLDAKGRVKVLDFGLAVFTARETEETEEVFITRTATTASAGGTAPYMSPELLRGYATDARSDIFSFGVVLFECFTGRRPFRGDTPIDTMHAILHQPTPSLRALCPELSPGWEELLERCLAKLPEQRFRSMADVLEGMQRMSDTAAPAAEKSLAVLYFENPGGAKEDEYFRDGITEDIITELANIKELRVFSRSAVLAYRDKSVAAPQVGRELNAAFVMEGSLRRAGNRLRLTAQLVDVRTGLSMWAKRYDRQLEDIFAIQDEIAQSIAQALQLVLSEKEKKAIVKAPTADVQAYDFYLRGRQFFYQWNRKGLEFARQMFARAAVIDPAYARAYSGVADCCTVLYQYYEASDANLKEADAASRKALELDADLAEAHVSRGMAVALNKRYEEAGAEFESAIRLNPRLFEAYYFYGRAKFSEGKLEEAAPLFKQASAVNPDDYQSIALYAMAVTSLGRSAEADAAYKQTMQIIEKHLQLHPDDARALYLGAICLSKLGKPAQSFEWGQRALSMDPEDPGLLYNVACVYALLDRTEDAIDCLEKAVSLGFGHKGWIQNDSDLVSLHSHPRFQALLQGL